VLKFEQISNMITIETIDLNKKNDKKRFVDFDYEIYKDSPHWVAPLRMDINERLNPKKHPFYLNGKIQCFVALRNGKIVGRIAAIDNNNYNEFHSSNVGFFGFFECINDQEIANVLFDKVTEWHQSQQNNILQGPVNPSTNYESGLLIDGFDDDPKIMMSYNPPYYQKLMENYGLHVSMKMYAYKVEDHNVLANEKLLRVKDIALQRSNTSLRLVNKKKLNLEIEHIKKIYNKAWENNWGFVPMSDAELNLMANELKLILDTQFAPMIENEKGEVVAFALALRDINVITKDFKGSLFPFNFLKLLFGQKKIKWIRVLLLGILPEYRGKGLDAVMYYEMIKNGLKVGIDRAEASWILESNPEMQKGMKVVNGEIYKTYAIFEKQIL